MPRNGWNILLRGLDLSHLTIFVSVVCETRSQWRWTFAGFAVEILPGIWSSGPSLRGFIQTVWLSSFIYWNIFLNCHLLFYFRLWGVRRSPSMFFFQIQGGMAPSRFSGWSWPSFWGWSYFAASVIYALVPWETYFVPCPYRCNACLVAVQHIPLRPA